MADMDALLQSQLEALENGKQLDHVIGELPPEAKELAPLISLAFAMRRIAHPRTQLNKVTNRQLATAANRRNRDDHRSKQQPIFAVDWLHPAFATLAVVSALLLMLAAGFWLASPRNVRAAVAMDIVGRVEVASRNSATDWRPVSEGDTVRHGQRIRTGAGAGVTLVFFEGSRAQLGAMTDVTLLTLDGNRSGVLRAVFEQRSGTTSHSVVPLHGNESAYQVRTASGNASVRGTVFNVTVAEKGGSLFSVDSGKVLVSSQQSSVMLEAGQVTSALPGQTSLEPGYAFELKGTVTSMGAEEWVVNGVTVKVSGAIIEGNPTLNSFVEVEGRVVDGEWIADHIEVTKVGKSKSEFTGILEDMDGDVWMVSGKSLQITSETHKDDDLDVGDSVEVKFEIVDGAWVALSIESLEVEPEETVTVTTTETGTETSSPTVDTATVTASPTVFVNCTGADPHPVGTKLADRYGVTYEEIMGWFCQGFGFGEIDHAYSLSKEVLANGVTLPVDQIFAMKSGGMGWGNIRKAVRKMTPTPTSSVTPVTPVPSEPPTGSPPAEPSNKNNPANQKPPKQPKGPPSAPQGGNQNQSCSGSGTNATAQSLASRYGVSYGQIMSMYCSGMSWGQIQQQFKQNPKKTPHP
jgi:hypothetical protein